MIVLHITLTGGIAEDDDFRSLVFFSGMLRMFDLTLHTWLGGGLCRVPCELRQTKSRLSLPKRQSSKALMPDSLGFCGVTFRYLTSMLTQRST